EERAAAARGELEATPIVFGNYESLPFGGVLFLVPFLIETGLLSFRNHYRELDPGYYYIDVIVMTSAFMYLCRIENPEQFKKISPGDFGKLLGLG
ncbi:putative transposase, partial [Limnospira sp. PMC 1298.21]|uniref:putative transposase n=1 Tax=Limnospira sp. PMC 1298.21 TaxID=2981081 RepID=UPI0028E0DBB0